MGVEPGGFHSNVFPHGLVLWWWPAVSTIHSGQHFMAEVYNWMRCLINLYSGPVARHLQMLYVFYYAWSLWDNGYWLLVHAHAKIGMPYQYRSGSYSALVWALMDISQRRVSKTGYNMTAKFIRRGFRLNSPPEGPCWAHSSIWTLTLRIGALIGLTQSYQTRKKEKSGSLQH